MANDLLFPVGRLVGGSVYTPKTTDADGNPLLIKNGVKAGQPRVDYYVGVAIAKGAETQWQATEWGKAIHAEGVAGFPQGQTNQPTFSWKITDGDSTIPNKRGNIPRDRIGYPGHWVLNFSGSFAPQLYCADGSRPLTEENAIKCGYYVQVFGSIKGNESLQQPGVYLNHNYIALSGYGEEISQGADPTAVGFGGALPTGASTTPVAQMTPPPPAAGTATPPPPPATHTMLPAANGMTYEQFTAAGWTDAMLISNGMMQP